MDIALLFVGIIFLVKEEYAWVLSIIVILASAYLQLALEFGGVAHFPFTHNIQDSGLILYILLFLSIIFKNKGRISASKLVKPVMFFYCFIMFSAFYDLFFNCYELGDIIRNFRHWSYLSILLIYKEFSIDTIKKSLNIIVLVTLFLCFILLLQRTFGFHLIGDNRVYDYGGRIIDRGVKPPLYSILAIVLIWGKVFQISLVKRYIYCIILFLPIFLSLKISYFVATILSLLFLKINNKLSIKIIPVSIGSLLCGVGFVVILFSVNPVFKFRFYETVQQIHDLKKKEVNGNFSYRILHFEERLDYCLSSFPHALLGIGSISEKNLDKGIFSLGQIDRLTGEKSQIDTADIAWSLIILRFGFMGIIIYLFMYWKITRVLFLCRENKLASAFCSYLLVNMVFLSFGNTSIAYSEFFIFPLLISGNLHKVRK